MNFGPGPEPDPSQKTYDPSRLTASLAPMPDGYIDVFDGGHGDQKCRKITAATVNCELMGLAPSMTSLAQSGSLRCRAFPSLRPGRYSGREVDPAEGWPDCGERPLARTALEDTLGHREC
jgi:hypothetical protein